MNNEHDINVLVRAAEQQVDRLTKGARLQRIYVSILAGVCALLLIGGVMLGYIVAQERTLATRVQHGSIAECRNINASRAASVNIWDYFIGVLLTGNTNPADLAKGREVEQHIAQLDAPRNCMRLYG